LQFPRLVLWAWERPEHLDFLNPRVAGVAYLARTITWEGGRVVSRPRLQPLTVPDGTRLMGVVRLESNGQPLGDPAMVVREIRAVAAAPAVRAIQLDFDARQSERKWYRTLLGRVRHALGDEMPLSITALASWCDGDRWIEGLPIVEAVPMLYRMGPRETSDAVVPRAALCQDSVGVATDELPAGVPAGRRLFVFHPRPWDREAYLAAVRLAERWK
jgi:hypothetical protein